MRRKHLPVLAILATITIAACNDQITETPQLTTDRIAASNSPNIAVHATGGAKWDLMTLDLDGDGVIDPVGNVLAFRAVRYADGSVQGQIEYQQSGLGETYRFHGTVTCVSVYEGNRARFGGPITWTDDETVPVGVFMWFTVVDNGEGAASPPDRSSIFGLGNNAANEAFCANPNPPNPRFSSDITSGNIQVH